ncbi:hypothetical protein FG379_000851 [Cryptosporidium bovis]|uniref:uncharacterized protein n=1 Tax=Cryptosporidium bovis TaxID=310047 RepID=UPI00351A157D|nr:hypothetical protein FG379_000851 [Cryptosporidium bovis]
MLTELQKQINSQLRSNELSYLAHKSSKLRAGNKRRISFLFDNNNLFYNKSGVTHKTSIPLYEDISQLRYLGEQGLIELESLNPEISKEDFSSLFQSNEFVSIQFLNQNEVEELLEKIRRFIDYLVPYFLIDSAKICIEYLIQVYDIHVLLGEYLFYSFLPYHDMGEFSILVQILEVKEESEIIGLVESIKKTKMIISSRNQLAIHLIRNQALFNNLVGFWEKRIKSFSSTKNSVLVNLITWLSIEIIDELTKVKEYTNNTENCLKNIISTIVFNLCIKNSRYEELRCAGYCIIYRLSTPLIRLSREIQERIIYELFNSLIINQGLGISDYLPEVLFIMNHLISQFKSLIYVRSLGYEVSKFILENKNLFVTAIKQLLSWDRNILQIFNLIIISVFDLGLVSDPNNYSEICVNFIQDLLVDINNHDLPLSLEENYGKLIKLITLALFDIRNQEGSIDKMVHYLYNNYPTEFMSALSFSLRVLTGSERARMESFISKIAQSGNRMDDNSTKDNEDFNESTRMFISLLNSNESEIVNSCINLVRNTILKSEKDFHNVSNFEKRIFDISIKHYFNFKDKSIDLFERYVFELLSIKGILRMAKHLDEESKSKKQEEVWRISFILKNVLLYIKSKITSVTGLDHFLSIEIKFPFEAKNSIDSIITNILFMLFGNEFKNNLLIVFRGVFDLFELIKESDSMTDNKEGIKSFISENNNIFIPLFALISKLSILSDNSKLGNFVDKLVNIMYKKEEVKFYCENFLRNTQINYIELLLFIHSIESCSDMKNHQKNSTIEDTNVYSEIINNNNIEISGENNVNFLGIMEYLYYKLYSGIHKNYMDLYKKNGPKNPDSVKVTNGTLILRLLRDLLSKGQLLKLRDYHRVTDQRLLNIVLLDTIEYIDSKNGKNLSIPSFDLIKECFKPKYDILKIKSLILGLSINSLNLISYSTEYKSENSFLPCSFDTKKKNKSSLFYGKNCYSETLISHSYSFLEILISKLPINVESNVTELRHFNEIVSKLLVYSVLPGLCTINKFTNSIRMASIRLCKSIKEKLLELENSKYFSSESEFKSIVLFDQDKENCGIFRSCYLEEEFPSLSQIFELFNSIVEDQSKFIINSADNFLKDKSVEIYKEGNNSDSSQLELISKLNILVFMEQFSTEENALNIENVTNYISKTLLYYNNSLRYHKFLLKFIKRLRNKLEINYCSKNQIILLLLFIKQGIDSLKNRYMNDVRKKIVHKYINELISLKGDNNSNSYLLEVAKTESDIKNSLEEVMLSIMDKDILINLEEDELVSFISYIIIFVSEYAPNRINDISLISITNTSLNLLDSLVIVLFKHINDYNSVFSEIRGENVLEYGKIILLKQNILSWLYSQIRDLNVFGSNNNAEINIKSIKEVFKYIERNIEYSPYLLEKGDSNHLDVIIRLIVYSIGILEYEFKNRTGLKYNEIEFLLDYLRNKVVGVDEKDNPIRTLLSNPMIMASITSLFTSVRFGLDENNNWKEDEDYYKSYYNLYKSLFTIYGGFVRFVGKDISEKNYNIRITLYSLSLFVEHNLNKCVYFDDKSITRMKSILFNILISNQVNEIINDSLKLNKIEDMISFMVKLHNEIIYNHNDNRSFGKNNCLFIIIKSLMNKLVSEKRKERSEIRDSSPLRIMKNDVNVEIKEKMDILMNYILANKLFDSRIDLYCNLLDAILDKIGTLINYNIKDRSKNVNDSLYIDNFSSENDMLLISISIVHFLNKTLFNMEINVDKCLNLVELADKLILIKTAMNKKLLKEIRHKPNCQNNIDDKLALMETSESGFNDNNKKLMKAKTRLRLKSKIDKLENELLFKVNDWLQFGLEGSFEIDYNIIQEEIDLLIKRIIENDTIKKFMILNWDISKETSFGNKLSLISKKFKNIMLDNKLEYLGLVLNDILNKNLRLELNKNIGDDVNNAMIYNIIVYLLENNAEYKEEIITKSSVRIWIKKWYIIEMILRIIQNQDIKIKKRLIITIFSNVVELYKYYYNKKDNYYGIMFKIPVIQNFLSIRLLNELGYNEVSIAVLKDIDKIVNDVLKTVDYLNVGSNIKLDKKIISILISIINNTNDKDTIKIEEGSNNETDSITILTIPYISLMNNILNSKIGTFVMNIGDLRKQLVRMIFLNERLICHLNVSRLTKLIKDEKIKDQISVSLMNNNYENHDDDLVNNLSKKSDKINSNIKYRLYIKEVNKYKGSENPTIQDKIENILIKLILIYCNISYSNSTSDTKINEDFIVDYSDMIKDITSNIFELALPSFIDENENKDNNSVKLVKLNYSRLCLLILMISYTLNFSQENSNILNNKSLIEKLIQLYLLLINFLIINFLKLYSGKDSYIKNKALNDDEETETLLNDTRDKNLKNKRKKRDKNSGNNNNNELNGSKLSCEAKLLEFVSSLLGNNILTSHCMVNKNWIGINSNEAGNSDSVDSKSDTKLSDGNNKCFIQIWELESSVMALLSVFTVKLNAKKLRELVLLIKRLIHRNGDSFISKVNDIILNKSKNSDIRDTDINEIDGNNKNNKLNEKMLIKEMYNKLQLDSNIDLVKDIYSCRVWMLILLTIIDVTGDYGVYCIIEDVILDIKSVNDLTQMNALTCIQNNALIQYSNVELSSKKSASYQQIANLNHNINDFGWYWYHLGIYNLMLIRLIYKSLCNQKDDSRDVPSCMENHLINPVITNLDMFALFDCTTYSSKLGSGKQWSVIINDIWLNTVNCYRNNDLILANILKSLVNKIRNGNKKVKIFSTEILLLLWRDETCSLSVLSHISELLPLIKELLSDSSEEINRIAKSIIKEIQERTGEDVSKQL